MADLIKKGEFYDPLSFQGRELTYPPMFHFLIAGLSFLFRNTSNVCSFLGALLGALTVVIFSLLLKELKVKYYLCLFFVFIPINIYIFGHCSSRSLTYFLGVLALYFLIKNKEILYTLIMALTIFSHPLAGLIFWFFSVIYILVNKKRLRLIIFSLILGLLFLMPSIVIHGFPQKNLLHLKYIKSENSSLNISSLWQLVMYKDASAALDLVVLVLGLIYLLIKKDLLLRLWGLFSIILAIVAERFRIFLGFVFAIASAKLVNNKKFWFVFILMILPFSIISINYLSTLGPSNEFCDAMSYIKNNSKSDINLLVPWYKGHQAEYLSNRKVILDGYAEYAPEVNERVIAYDTIYYSNNTNLILENIQKFDIDYIISDENDKQIFKEFSELYYKNENIWVYKIKDDICYNSYL